MPTQPRKRPPLALETLRKLDLLGPTSSGRLPLTRRQRELQRAEREARMLMLCAGEMPGWRPVSITSMASDESQVVLP